MITFDYERGYEEAKVKLENSKEDFEKLRLIREEIQQISTNKKVQEKSPNSTKKEESKAERESRAKRELEEISKQRKERTLQYITPQHAAATKNKLAPKQQNQSPELELSKDHITIWDLPTWARRSQVFESICYLGRVAHIEMIREPRGKTRAEVNFLSNTANSKDLAETWCLPFMRDQLVRVTLEKCNLEELKAHNTYNRKLLNLPEDTNEVLLWRQVRRTGAKALHIVIK